MPKKTKNRKRLKKQQSKSHDNKSFFHLVWTVIRNSEDTQGQFIKTTFVFLMSYLLNVFFVLLGLLSVVGAYFTIQEIFVLSWNSISTCIVNTFMIMLMLLLCAIAFLFSILLKGFANEVEREKDKDYIVAIFSGIVSFIALIVAVIALLRG